VGVRFHPELKSALSALRFLHRGGGRAEPVGVCLL